MFKKLLYGKDTFLIEIFTIFSTDYGQLTEEEEMETGPMSSAVIGQYIQAMGGFGTFILLLFCFAIPVAGVTLAGWYLQHWLAQGSGVNTSQFKLLSV